MNEDLKNPIEGEQKQENATDKDKNAETLTMTQAELDKLLQQTGDKRVQQALQTHTEKLKAELKAEMEAEKNEAEKMAKLTTEERAKAEIEKEREALRKEREALNKEKLLTETAKQLGEQEIPVEFASYLVGVDAETTLENIKVFSNAWQKALEKAVNAKLANGFTPKASGTQTGVTLEQFTAMNYVQRSELARINPDLYKLLKSQEK